MPFNAKSGKFNASIKEVEIGTGAKAIKIGGENVLPFYTFDAPIANAPKIGVEVSDLGLEGETSDGVKEFYAGCETVVDMAKKAAEMPGADFVCVRFASADPNGEDAPIEKCAELAKAVADAVDAPLAFMGCGSDEKDADLLVKVAEAVDGKNVLILSAKEENYKMIGMSAVQAYHHKVAAESAVDINLAKQVNVLMTQLGVSADSICMHVGTATAGYGYEYVATTMDRTKAAALAQNDTTLQMPFVTPVSTETYNCKECLAAEEDFPEWGSRETRIIDMEVVTAAADLASGSNAVILKNPVSVATIKKMIDELM
ncbi:Acetyl-CoA synthase corrinoid iron-sulfur protein, small subunit [Lachnospiraceae bacterium TWA4]|nr:Acetyl-CoA synthase corrinoid iron-sulfur protein, small subunit [Lachnospiraceae bacterium TWA4]